MLEQVRGTASAPLPAGGTGLEEFDQVIEALARARDLQANAETSLDARTRELSVVLETVPAAVWFTYDRNVKEVKRNAHASRLLRLDHDNRASIGSGQLAHFQVYRNGALCLPSDLPLQRAFNGENVRDEEYQFRFSSGDELTLLTSAEPLSDAAGSIVGAVSVSVDITDRKRSETHQKMLMNELNHRVKNTLSTVQSVARRTLRTSDSMVDAERALSTRLVAIARAYDVLTRQNWQGAEVKASFEGIQNAYGLGRITISGPEFHLSPANSVTLSLVAHELAVNATKYGALSNETGRIHVEWLVAEEKEASVLVVRWQEDGGPPVTPPQRTGFGTDLLQRLRETEAIRHSIEYRPEGIVCVFSLGQSRLTPQELVATGPA
jgi:two-component sensor histidine kinase